MMITFADARVWKYVISAIAKVVSETSMRVDESGVRIKTMDEAKVVLVDFFIPAEAFEKYEVEGEVEFGINMDDLAKVMRRAQKEDVLSIEVGESTYSIIYEGIGVRKFTLPQLDVAVESLPDVSGITFEVKVEMTSDAYREMVKDLEPIADTVTFIAEPSNFRVEAMSDLGEAEVIIPEDSGVLLSYEVNPEEGDSPPKSSYGVEHLAYISTASQVATSTTLEFSNEKPLKVTFDLGKGGSLVYLVAPRIL